MTTFNSIVIPVIYTPSVFSVTETLPVTVSVSAVGVTTDAYGDIEVIEAAEFSVNGLSAVTDGDNIILSWELQENASQQITDSFESYGHGAISEVGNWTLVDKDGGLAGGMAGKPLPHDDEAYSFMVINPEDANLGDFGDFAPHSGQKYLIASYVYNDDDYVDCDDWIISPELAGSGQTVSFWINSYDGDEAWELLYSTTGNAPADFIKIKNGTVDTEWTQITAELPDGAKYFAIRRVTDGYTAFYMMIDDISYSTSVNVDHYNVYVDGEYVGQTREGIYTYPCDDYETHKFSVTIVVDDGREFAPGSIVYGKSGVNDVLSDDEMLYDVYTVTGIRVLHNGSLLNNLLPGVYIVNGEKVVIK